jgi:hypothetical protein
MTMATRADLQPAPPITDDGFFLGAAIAMTLVIIAGFSLQLAMGRSSFAAPPLVHAHALVFMGWVGIYLAQNALVYTGNVALHRRLGWLAAVWVVPMLALGLGVTLALVRGGRVPFFFTPQQFLIFDPMTLFGFAGLTAAAIRLRRHSDWHRRLHFCAMTLLLGPGFGRLLPMPLLAPQAFEASFAATMIFPAAGVIADLRRTGRVHPAWGWGIAVLVLTFVVILAIDASPLGAALYDAVTAGTPGADVPGRALPPPPGPPLA